MLNLNPEEKYDEHDVLMLEIEAALREMTRREMPANLGIRISASVTRYEMARALAEPEAGFSFWGWLDRVIAFLTRPLALVTAIIVVAFWFVFVANDPTWLHATNQLTSVGNSIAVAFGSLFANLGQFYPALIVGMALVAIVALTPRIRDLRQMLREEQGMSEA
jgi:hypothetical protein